VASKNSTHYIVKLANYGPDVEQVSVSLFRKSADASEQNETPSSSGILTLVGGSQFAKNTYGSTEVQPATTVVDEGRGMYEFELPGWTVGVLVFERPY
jgi:hypothetical protein